MFKEMFETIKRWSYDLIYSVDKAKEHERDSTYWKDEEFDEDMILDKHPDQDWEGPAIGYWYSKLEPDLPHPEWYEDFEWNEVERDLIIAYLENGKSQFQYLGSSNCRICGKSNGSSCLTDGYYIWPKGFAHYLEEHGIKPPEKFIKYVKNTVAAKVLRGLEMYNKKHLGDKK